MAKADIADDAEDDFEDDAENDAGGPPPPPPPGLIETFVRDKPVAALVGALILGALLARIGIL